MQKIKKQYLKGKITRQEAIAKLVALGIDREYVTIYLSSK